MKPFKYKLAIPFTIKLPCSPNKVLIALDKKGREWALSDEAGFTAEKMSNRIIEAIDELFDTWEPREKYELIDTNIDTKKTQTHALIY